MNELRKILKSLKESDHNRNIGMPWMTIEDAEISINRLIAEEKRDILLKVKRLGRARNLGNGTVDCIDDELANLTPLLGEKDD